jgi:hypothetical protein
MKLQQQVCTLESAKRLKELGVKQESYFYWQVPNSGNLENKEDGVEIVHYPTGKFWDYYSAFTVAELGELLPSPGVLGWLEIFKKEDGNWMVRYSDTGYRIEEDLNEAEVRAQMLIYLLENNLITL